MASLNRVLLIGNLGQDPELTYTPNRTAKALLKMATNETWKDRDGEKQQRTEWHRVICWARLAEICGQYLSKGSQVFIEGRLQTRSWEDRDGNKRYMTEIIGISMQMLGSRRDSNGGSTSSGYEYGGPEPEDDIPF